MKKPIILSVVLLSILLLQWFVLDIIDGLSPRVEFNAKDFALNRAQSITVPELNRINEYEISYRKIFTATVDGVAVNTVVTNGRYDKYREFNITRGSFFTEAASDLGLNMAVISEEFSFTLFQSINTVGKEISVNGLRYKITGVYAQNGLISFMTANGRENIYIPAGSDADRVYGGDTAIQSIVASPQADTTPGFTETVITRLLSRVSGNTANYIPRDYTSAARVIRQFLQIEIFLSALIVYVFAAKWLLHRIPHQKGKDITGILVFILKGVTVLLACLMIYRLTSFELYINPRYISSERLLDFAFYFNLIKEMVQEHNLYYAYVPPVYERLYSGALLFNAAACGGYCWGLGVVVSALPFKHRQCESK